METASTQWTVGRLIEWTRTYLGDRSIDHPRLATELLLAHALNCRKIDLYARFDTIPTPEQLAFFREAVKKASERQPIAYLVGKKEFYSMEFEVSPAVLIPRPETEVLVEQVLHYCKTHPKERYDILDFGTGSGCIGLAIARYVAGAQVIGSDICPEALAVAERNAQKLKLSDRFSTIQSDGFATLNNPDRTPGMPGAIYPGEVCKKFDILVSNPPYVAESDSESLASTVKDFEPHRALFAGEKGLHFYERIVQESSAVLKPGAAVFLEIGCDQHDPVADIMTATKLFTYVQSWRDRNEGHWRVMHFIRDS